MSQEALYMIRDQQGNVYGPANAITLLQWAREGRIVPGMFVTDHLGNWIEASSHPLIYQAFTNGPPFVSTPVSATRIAGSATALSYGDPRDVQRLNIIGLFSFFFAGISYPLACCCFMPFITAMISICLGVVSLLQFQHHPMRYRGKWMPVSAIVFSLFILLFLMIAYISGFDLSPYITHGK